MDNPAPLSNVLNQQCLHIWVWQEDDGWIAKCLDIPGCVSQGDTREEALKNINEAIALCLDVIREDAANEQSCGQPIEVIEKPLSEFTQA